jgi:hypothetical protein
MSKNTEIAVKETEALAVQSEAMGMDAMMEELEGLGPISLEQVKIPSGGGLAFEVPGDDPESPDVVQTLRGVVVHHQPKNVYFRNKFGEGETNTPDCSSSDGKIGIMTASGAEKTCATCKFNQFGSAADGKGKACQNRIDLYIMREDAAFPIVLSLPATSIKAFKNYLTSIVLKQKRLYQAVTEVSLKKVKSAGGINYSTCVFKKAGEVSPEEVLAMAEMRELCKSLASMQKTAPVVDESTGEVVDVTGEPDEDFPF